MHRGGVLYSAANFQASSTAVLSYSALLSKTNQADMRLYVEQGGAWRAVAANMSALGLSFDTRWVCPLPRFVFYVCACLFLPFLPTSAMSACASSPLSES